MLKLFIFTGLLALSLCAELYYTPGAYYAPGAVYSRSSAMLPLAYSRVYHPITTLETYNTAQTPESYQQQYRSDYKPLVHIY